VLERRRNLAPGCNASQEARRHLLAGEDRQVRQDRVHHVHRPQTSLLHRQHHDALQLPRHHLASGPAHFSNFRFISFTAADEKSVETGETRSMTTIQSNT